MNGFNVVFVKSTDHGATWSAPVKTYGNVSWNDKPVIAVSDDGRDVYATFNGPTGGDPWLAQSHDFGATWAQTKLVEQRPLLLRVRRGRRARRHRLSLAVEHPLWRRWQQGHDAERDDRPPRLRVNATAERPGPTGTWRRSNQGWPARRRAARPTSTSATAPCRPTPAAPSPCCTTARRLPAGSRPSSRGVPPTGGATWTAPVTLSKAGEMATSPAVESRGTRRRARVVDGDERRQRRCLERLVSPLDRRRRDVGFAGEDGRSER